MPQYQTELQMSPPPSFHLASQKPPIQPAERGEIFALTRALVFTKEAYRNLRWRGAHASAPKAAASPADSPVLTPWDMIDEEAGEAGIAFTPFQQRSERSFARRVA